MKFTKLLWTINFLMVSVFASPVVYGVPDPKLNDAHPPFHIKPSVTTAFPTGLAPMQVRHSYGFDQITNQGAGQIIAIVDAYDDPNIQNDLNVFDKTFALPACTTANGCFQKIYASGFQPTVNSGWAVEIALDVEWAHAIAPQAKILLVEASTSRFSDLMHAVNVAVQNGASVVSMSWGGSEFSSETAYDSNFIASGVTFVAASGDSGTGTIYPSVSPYVIAVGGTSLSTNSLGTYLGEVAWSGSGGGLSLYELKPAYQTQYGIPHDTNNKRGVPDVAFNANPNVGFSVYDTVRYQGQQGWFVVGGTSAGSPQWAGLFAVANAMRSGVGKSTLTGTNTLLYSLATSAYLSNYHDILAGSNGSCGVTYCSATSGYDYVTGLGSPVVNTIINSLLMQ